MAKSILKSPEFSRVILMALWLTGQLWLFWPVMITPLIGSAAQAVSSSTERKKPAAKRKSTVKPSEKKAEMLSENIPVNVVAESKRNPKERTAKKQSN